MEPSRSPEEATGVDHKICQIIGKVLSHITGCELSRSDRVMMLQKHLYLLFFFIRQVEMLNLAMGMLVLILFDTFRTWVAQEQVQVGLDTR